MRTHSAQRRTGLGIGVATALIACAACQPAAERPAGEAAAPGEPELVAQAREAAGTIDAEGLRAPVAYLASDELEGRGPGSEGDVLARRYLAERLEALGYEPAGDGGGWEQPFEVVGVHAKVPETWSFVAGETSLDLAWWDDYIASSGVQAPGARIEDAELVFVGYGIQAPEYSWDDYKGADVRGKVLVMLNNDPDWDPQIFAGDTRLYYGRWTYKYEIAGELGAAAAIILHTSDSAGYPWQVVQTSWTGEQFELPSDQGERVQVAAWVTDEAARRLVALAGHDLDALRESARSPEFQPIPLGVSTSLDLDVALRGVETANVLGVLRGRDAELSRQMVVYTAHHDHLGVGQPDDTGDTIHNGALDNAAGVAQLLEIAEAFRALPEPPRRSVLFAFVAAEEQGLLGSEYLARHPPVPPGLLAANLNHDGGNIWGATEDVTFIGHGKSSLDEVVERFAAEQDRVVVPDQFPDKGYFYRSDQFNLAKIGVPAIYLDNGTRFVGRPPEWGRQVVEAWTEEQYHQPADELDDTWNFEGMIQDAQLSFLCGVAVAESDEMPAWNPGDEFEAARLAALQEVAEEAAPGRY